MNELHAWLLNQHHGLQTLRIFQKRLETLSRDEPDQKALCRLLSSLAGSYIDAYYDEPLPAAVADRAYHRLLDLLASLAPQGSAERRLADMNRIAAFDLLH